jgi:adenosylhomocysteinase
VSQSKQPALEDELSHLNFSFPILQSLGRFLQQGQVFSGKKIAWHCHLTSLTAATVQVLCEAGAIMLMSECNSNTSDAAAIEYMRSLGAQIFLGQHSERRALEERPMLISDTGCVMISEYLKLLDENRFEPFVVAASEITSSGIQSLRQLKQLKLPVFNINDGQLKHSIENFHGVGDGVIDALMKSTGRLWAGRKAAVVGYGPVGAGVAAHLARAGAVLSIVETDPVRKLKAHYDGYALCTLEQAARSAELLVSATGSPGLIGKEVLQNCRDGIILMNVGHWGEEIDLPALEKLSAQKRQIAAHLEEFEFKAAPDCLNPKRIYLLGGAGPANVVMLSGSAEPTLIHLTTEILTMQYILKSLKPGQSLPPGELPVPAEVERKAASLALECLGLD